MEKLKRQGFTLVELLGSLAIIAVIATLAIPTFFTVQKKVLEGQLRNKISYIEAKAEQWASTTDDIKINVGRLIELGYLEADDILGQIYNPVTKESMNCLVISIKKENENYIATLTDELVCEFDLLDQQNAIVKITVTKESNNAPLTEDTNWWSEENVLATLEFREDQKELENGVTSITWSLAGHEKEVEITDFGSQNKYVATASSILNAVLTAEVKMEKEGELFIYHASQLIKIDKQKPTIYKSEVSVSNPEEWSNEAKNVSVITSDGDGSGVAKISVSTEKDCTKASYSNTMDGTFVNSLPEGLYYICVQDLVGNLSEQESTSTVEVSKIDNIGPMITATPSNTWGYTNLIDFIITDDQSGVTRYKFTDTSDDESDWSGIDRVNRFQSTINNIEKNGTYYIWAQDAAGNKSKKEVLVQYVDRNGPEISSLTENNTWGSSSTITAQVRDQQSGLVAYAFTSTNQTPSSWTPIQKTTMTKTITNTVTSNGTYYFWAKDLVGNISKQTVQVKHIDKTAPTITLTTDTVWSNVSNKVTAKVLDNQSGIAKYAWTTTNQKPTNWITTQNKTVETSFNNTYYENQTVYFWAQDAAGNTRSKSINVNRIDKLSPNATITFSPSSWTNYAKKANVTASDTGGSGVKLTEYSTDYGKTYHTFKNTFTTSANLNYVRVTDNAGNITYVYNYAYIDTSPPYTPTLDIKGTEEDDNVERVSCTKNDDYSFSDNSCTIYVSRSNAEIEWWYYYKDSSSEGSGSSGIAREQDIYYVGSKYIGTCECSIDSSDCYEFPTNDKNQIVELKIQDVAGNWSTGKLRINVIYP